MKKDNYIFLATGDVPLSSLTTNDFIDALRQYESTGLTPIQVEDMQFVLMEKSRHCGELRRKIRELEERGG